MSNLPALKHIKILHNIQKHKKGLLASLIIFFFLLCFYPFIFFRIGCIFFGDVKYLYNFNLAHASFLLATNPINQKLTPRYAHYQLARLYFIKGDLYRAINEGEQELALYKESDSVYYLLGLSYGFLGQTHLGIDAFSHYIEKNPETWAARNDKAWLQFRIGDFEGALKTIEPVLKYYPLTPWVQNTHCILLINTKKYNQAKSVCEKAKVIIDNMKPEDWGHSYPGNDPRIYEEGLRMMRKSIRDNLLLIPKEE